MEKKRKIEFQNPKHQKSLQQQKLNRFSTINGTYNEQYIITQFKTISLMNVIWIASAAFRLNRKLTCNRKFVFRRMRIPRMGFMVASF